MNICTERPTDPPSFEDEIFPEDDADIKRKEEIESQVTEDFRRYLREITRGLDKEPWT